jgi:branched-chain amino acid transport system permease protein
MFNQLFLNGIIVGSIYALIALGFTVIYKTVRFFHFAHGVVYTAGAYFAYSLFMSVGIDPILSFFLPHFLQPSLA